jgi:hypothetical protein
VLGTQLGHCFFGLGWLGLAVGVPLAACLIAWRQKIQLACIDRLGVMIARHIVSLMANDVARQSWFDPCL